VTEVQSLRAYIEEQQEQMQQIIGGMQNDYKRLTHAFDKSVVANFASYEVENEKTHVIHRLQIGMTNHNPFTGC
jgi:hypothetical protein